MRIGVTTSTFAEVDPGPLELLQSRGLEVILNPYGRRLTKSEAARFIRDLDGLIAGLEPLDRDVLQEATSLKALARVGIGTDNIDFDAAEDLRISVSSTPEPPAAAVAEMTLTAMLSLVRNFCHLSAAFRAGEWRKSIGGSLNGATVLVIGLGRIGRRVASLVDAFGANVLGTDPLIKTEEAPPRVRLVPLYEGLSVADIVSLHASGSEVILSSDELAKVKPGAILLNSARGDLVEETALGEALVSGRIRAAWFDSFWREPYAGNLRELPGFYGTPHVATYTASCRSAMEMQAVRNLLQDLGIPATP